VSETHIDQERVPVGVRLRLPLCRTATAEEGAFRWPLDSLPKCEKALVFVVFGHLGKKLEALLRARTARFHFRPNFPRPRRHKNLAIYRKCRAVGTINGGEVVCNQARKTVKGARVPKGGRFPARSLEVHEPKTEVDNPVPSTDCQWYCRRKLQGANARERSQYAIISSGTSENLKTYVYRLIDPRNGETFHVGKGRGNRVSAHIYEVSQPNGQRFASSESGSTSHAHIFEALMSKTVRKG
jgi:hypothetical protein